METSFSSTLTQVLHLLSYEVGFYFTWMFPFYATLYLDYILEDIHTHTEYKCKVK